MRRFSSEKRTGFAAVLLLIAAVLYGCGMSDRAAGTIGIDPANTADTGIAEQATPTEERPSSVPEPSRFSVSDAVFELLPPEKEKADIRRNITFSVPSGIYHDDITVELHAPGEAAIHYTLDGSDPTEKSPVYSQPLTFKAGQNVSVCTLKASVLEGETPQTVCANYVLCSKEDPFGLDCMCISTDPSNLYDYEKGIFVPGKTYEEQMKDDSIRNKTGNMGQRGEEWERPAYATMFSRDGETVIDREVLIAVSGGTSSFSNWKSLKVSIDETTDDSPFVLDLYRDDSRFSSYSFVDQYKSIRLREESQVDIYGNIRSAVYSRLAAECGFDGITATRRCVLFLNNQFVGIRDIQQNYSDSFLKNHFGLNDSDRIVKEKGSEFESLEALSTGILILMEQDMNAVENREKLEKLLDVDNYFRHYLVNIFFNNTDFPQNNFEAWRYDGDVIEGNPCSDGRIRFLAYDTDITWTTRSMRNIFDEMFSDSFENIMTSKGRANSNRLMYLLRYKGYRDRFLNMLCDMERSVFNSENVEKVIREEYGKIGKANSLLFSGDYVRSSDKFVQEYTERGTGITKQVRRDVKRFFGLEKRHHVSVHTSEGCELVFGNNDVFANSALKADYYDGTELTIRAVPYPGYLFDRFIVNGIVIREDEITVDSEAVIYAFCKKDPDAAPLIITKVAAEGDRDFITLQNISDQRLNLDAFYLTDDPQEPHQYRCPEAVLEPGGFVTLYGKSYPECDERFRTTLGLKKNEILVLYDENAECCDSIVLLNMSDVECYSRYDGSSHWMFERLWTAE